MAEDLAAQLLAGNRRSLARVISHVEDGTPEAGALLSALYPHTGHAHVVGVTGAPGTGKSTLVNALARSFRAAGLSVGIIAVDPSSPFSGGALLGDRVRMRDLAGDPGIFIRSMATRGSLGGLAKTTGEVISVLDAAGFDRILVETVGVGQAEIDIAGAAHTTIVVEAPGMGDEVQAIKAGVLEIADLFAVNKADRDGADHTVMALRMMQGLAGPGSSHHRAAPGAPRSEAAAGALEGGDWLPPIVKTIATRGEGAEALRNWIEAHRVYLAASGQLANRENAHANGTLGRVVRDELFRRLLDGLPDGDWQAAVDAIARRETDPHAAAAQLVRRYIPSDSPR